MTTHEDRFWITFGKAVAVCSFLFVFVVASLCIVLLVQIDRDAMNNSPTLLAPDTLKARPK